MVRGRVKHKPPSRVKYERDHPVISCRVPKEVYSEFQNIREATGKSVADILKESVGIQEAKLEEIYDRAHKDTWEIAFEEGREEGREEGKKFELAVCSKCGKPLFWDLNEPKQRELLAKAINKFGFVHKGCK